MNTLYGPLLPYIHVRTCVYATQLYTNYIHACKQDIEFSILKIKNFTNDKMKDCVFHENSFLCIPF